VSSEQTQSNEGQIMSTEAQVEIVVDAKALRYEVQKKYR